MSITKQIAEHIRDVHFGGNWTWVNLKGTLEGITWQQATTKVDDFNTIAALTFHINYFVEAILKVFDGKPLDSKDMYSFDHPPVNSTEDWEAMLNKTWAEAERLAAYVEQFPDDRLMDTFVEEKYGNYYRNLHGLIEHTHYHMGQIVILKKIVQGQEK